ncbi:MAG TPA: hypothetical protein VGF84_12420, partial [Micromonosporaceae bacterium]
TEGCGSDDAAQQRYRSQLAAAGLDLSERAIEYTGELELDHLVGAMLSVFPAQFLPTGADRERFGERIRTALGGGPFIEPVRVGLLLGRRD